MNNFVLVKCNTLKREIEVVGSYGSRYDAKESMMREYKKAFEESEIPPYHSVFNEMDAKLCYNEHAVLWQITEKEISVQSCNTKDSVSVIDEMINNTSFNPREVASGCSKLHRYLQNVLGEFCLYYLAEMAKHKKNCTFDGRNEYVCHMAEKIFDKVEELKCYVEM